MQVNGLAPLVYELLEQNPEIKKEASHRGKIALYLRMGKIGQARTEAKEGYGEQRVTESLENIEEGTVITYEKIGQIFHVSQERTRQMLHDLIVFVGLKHLKSLKK